MTIRILTKIDAGIYASQGGGKTHVSAEANTGPRNLLRLAGALRDIAKSATLSYGNIGHNGTWMEIDGVRIEMWDADDLAEGDKGDGYWIAAKSRTQKAAELIGFVQSGAYAQGQADADKSLDDIFPIPECAA